MRFIATLSAQRGVYIDKRHGKSRFFFCDLNAGQALFRMSTY
jgi:hypothetical protein